MRVIHADYFDPPASLLLFFLLFLLLLERESRRRAFRDGLESHVTPETDGPTYGLRSKAAIKSQL